MKWHALKDKPGAYEHRRDDGGIFGGIMIDGRNRGLAFVGSVENKRYFFEFEDGVFSKTVKICGATPDNPIGTIELGFMDGGTLRTAAGNYAWRSTGASKIWTNAEKNAVMFLDLETEPEQAVAVLSSESLAADCRELLLLSGWYLLVVEYRAGLTNCMLAGAPVKTAEFKRATGDGAEYGEWWDAIVDALAS